MQQPFELNIAQETIDTGVILNFRNTYEYDKWIQSSIWHCLDDIAD